MLQDLYFSDFVFKPLILKKKLKYYFYNL